MLVVYLFICRYIPFWKKVATFVVLVLLTASATITPLNNVWTGFSQGLNYYCRWGFVMEFFVLYFAACALEVLLRPLEGKEPDPRLHRPRRTVRGLIRESNLSSRGVELCAAVLICLILSALSFLSGGFAPFASLGGRRLPYYVVFLFILLSYAALVVWSLVAKSRRMQVLSIVGLLLVVSIDMGGNALISLKGDYQYFQTPPTVETVENYFSDETQAIDAVKENDGTVYRLDKTYSMVADTGRSAPTNEGLALGFYPLSGYWSTNDSSVASCLSRLG